MRETLEILLLLLLGGILILLGIGTISVYQAADAMTKLASVSGNTVAEAYYQAVGRALKGMLFLGGAGLLLYAGYFAWKIWHENR